MKETIGYFPSYFRIPVYYYGIAILLGIGTYIILCKLNKLRRIGISLLVSYVFLVLAVTVFSRELNDQTSILMEPLQSYRRYITDEFTRFEIQANIILFIPIGILAPMSMKRLSVFALIIGLIISLSIEALQFVTGRGVFEFDDLISNLIGFLIGFAFYCFIHLLVRISISIKDKKKKNK